MVLGAVGYSALLGLSGAGAIVIRNSLMKAPLLARPWEHVIATGLGLYFGAKIGKMNAATWEVMQYEKDVLAPKAAWLKDEE